MGYRVEDPAGQSPSAHRGLKESSIEQTFIEDGRVGGRRRWALQGLGWSLSSYWPSSGTIERCGWISSSPNSNYIWEARQRGASPLTSGPSSDYTTGTASGFTGLGQTPLWASVRLESGEELPVWRPGNSSVNGWREADIFLGRISSGFWINLHSERSVGLRDDVAVDQLEFLDCALPDGYQSCDFEKDLCSWDLRSYSPLKWTRTTQNNISTTDPLKGPGRDHSNNSASGHFLYVTVPEEGLKVDWAVFQSPRLQPTNSTHPCKLVMYSHQFGPRAGGLSVLVASKNITPAWERGGALGDLWVKAEVEVVIDTTFQLLVVAAIRKAEYGGVGVDSLRLSPGCRLDDGNTTAENFPSPPEHPCTENSAQICDFVADCSNATDESKCGDFSYAQGSSGWTDRSVGSQGWKLWKMSNSTTKEVYLYVSEAPGQQLTGAESRSPPLGPSGPACSLTFSYALTGPPEHIGELSVRLIDSSLGLLPALWEFSGKTGPAETDWRMAQVDVGHRQHRFQLAFEARATTQLKDNMKIRVKDVRYLNCHPAYLPSSTSEMSCNFEDDLCGWYQDHSDNFDWTLLSGMDHTIGNGKSLVVDFWDPTLRGAHGRLRSIPMPAFSEDRCLTFFYKLYGTQTGFDGRIAIDDVALLERPCSVPRLCSFEGQRCDYTSSGDIRWGHRNGHEAGPAGGPKTDHTLQTELGYYMMVHSGVDDLRPDGHSTLSSPVHPGSGRTHCVHFWYHMGREHPDVWRHGNANISSSLVDWQLEFEVVGGGGKGTHVAIDDIALLSHPCDSEGSSCTLEQGLCGWSNTNHLDRDTLDWDITSSQTETHYQVPSHDHTLGTEQGHFLFFPSSSRAPANQNSRLVSAHLPPTKGTCLSFWAHRPSSADSMLTVWRLTEGSQLHQLLKVDEVGATWVRFHVSITSTNSYQIVLEGVRGTVGVLALDDIQYTVGTDCEGRVTDPQDEQPLTTTCCSAGGGQAGSNGGGIAASVIVVLLLLGTLVALLVFFLRHRGKADTLIPERSTSQSEASVGHGSFSNDDCVTVPPMQNHPMAAGFNNVLTSVRSDIISIPSNARVSTATTSLVPHAPLAPTTAAPLLVWPTTTASH
ncbi:hypothetical protein CRUP_033212 [Coryphaenoides rupestris]|nr:hypothetical protein CRUP_033212 [Coryphaenoides rupestris]